ncbi:calpain-B-like [Armigeres subalbatus]|uniref:calpain-B-like n=1 Tax=Armigeres subalbatus TaxID=124917 RepID=UPI002ED5EA93
MESSCEQSKGIEMRTVKPLSRFLIVEFTDDNIVYIPKTVAQNPDAQDFHHLKQRIQGSKTLFEDPDFPACNQSILGHDSKSNIQWVRPSEIIAKPKFFIQAPPNFNIVEKRTVLHSFLSTALACLTTNYEAFLKVVPLDNSFEAKMYTGMFRFRFWQYGRWVEVVIDDRLPTMEGKLLFIRPTEQDEFWCALLEKAYAKLCGSYSAIMSSNLSETMQDFTGGITERYYLGDSIQDKAVCFETISRKLRKGSIMAAVKMNQKQGTSKQIDRSYSILNAIIVENKLIGLHTPVEELIEMHYLHSVHNSLPAECYRKHWLLIDDFVKNYDFVEICNMSPDQMSQPLAEDYSWQLSCINGAWLSGYTAGGSKDDLKSFWTNPQYIIQLAQPDQLDNSGLCHLVITLMQKRQYSGYLPISFVVFQLTDDNFRANAIPMSFSKKKLPKIVAHPNFSSTREVTSRVKIGPSSLLIVPCTQKQNMKGEFYLRIYSLPRRKAVEGSTSNMGSNWQSMVRTFHSFADANGTIDHLKLATILNSEFFAVKPKSKRKSSFWKTLTRKRSPPLESNESPNTSHQDFIEQLAQVLISPGQPTAATPDRLNYDGFRRIIRDVQQWKEMFDLYDPDRKGYLDRRKLIKSLMASVSEEQQQQHSMRNLLQWLELELEDKIGLDEFIYYSQQSPHAMEVELKAQLSDQIFHKMGS